MPTAQPQPVQCAHQHILRCTPALDNERAAAVALAGIFVCTRIACAAGAGCGNWSSVPYRHCMTRVMLTEQQRERQAAGSRRQAAGQSHNHPPAHSMLLVSQSRVLKYFWQVLRGSMSMETCRVAGQVGDRWGGETGGGQQWAGQMHGTGSHRRMGAALPRAHSGGPGCRHRSGTAPHPACLLSPLARHLRSNHFRRWLPSPERSPRLHP